MGTNIDELEKSGKFTDVMRMSSKNQSLIGLTKSIKQIDMKKKQDEISSGESDFQSSSSGKDDSKPHIFLPSKS